MSLSPAVWSARLGSLLAAMLPLAPGAPEDSIKMMLGKDPVKLALLEDGPETRAPSLLLIVSLYAATVLTALLALFLVLNVQGIASHWSLHKTGSKPVRTAPKECSPSSQVQMTPPSAVRSALPATTATQG